MAPADSPGVVSRVAEALVPGDTFGGGERGRRTLFLARCVLFILYLLVFAAFSGMLLSFLLGRYEIIDQRVKYDKLEAPSLAVCPWDSGQSVHKHSNASYTMFALKFSMAGAERLPNTPKTCKYDRTCQCLDLSDVVLHDMEDSHKSQWGNESEAAQYFRERIEVHTTLRDPSPVRSLKLGFYDSSDHRPSWFYVRQFFFIIGQLRMDSWMVSEDKVHDLMEAAKGDYSKISKRRHIYSYTFSSTDDSMVLDAEHNKFTRVSYEFRSFFVVETYSGTKAWSLFTCVTLLMLMFALSNILTVWEHLFPAYVGDSVTQKRGVSKALLRLASCCGTDIGHDHEAEQGGQGSGYGAA